jgi:hypothetical protein
MVSASIWKETIMAIFSTESWYLHEDNEEDVEKVEDSHQLVIALEYQSRVSPPHQRA